VEEMFDPIVKFRCFLVVSVMHACMYVHSQVRQRRSSESHFHTEGRKLHVSSALAHCVLINTACGVFLLRNLIGSSVAGVGQ